VPDRERDRLGQVIASRRGAPLPPLDGEACPSTSGTTTIKTARFIDILLNGH